jgi:hypothetical protein
MKKIALALAAVLAFSPQAARAQQSSTIAEALFQEAQKLLEAGKIKEACEKFAASQKVEPATGTLLNLAACHEKEGRTATAWTEYSEALAQAQRAGDKQREAYAKRKIETLEKQLHRVVIEILSPVPSTEVKLDGHVLAREAWGTGIPLDPGEHSIEVAAPGYKTYTRKLNMGPSAGTDRIEVPKLEEQAVEKPVEAPPPPAVVVAPPPPEKSSGPSKRTIGFVVAGAGVVSVAVAAVFGIKALSDASTRDDRCPPGTPCFDQSAFDADRDARVSQQIMLITGGAGLVLGGVGTWLILTSRDEEKRTGVRVLPRLGGVSLVGRF